MFYLLLVFGIIVRFLLVGVPGFKADIAFWKGWGLAVADKGIIWLVNNTNYNYPPGFAYILWIVNKVYALFKSPYNINEYWQDTNYLYLFIFKLITIAADIFIVWLLIKISRKILNPKSEAPNKSEIRNPKHETNSNTQNSNLKNNVSRFTFYVLHINFSQWLSLFYFLNLVVLFDGVIWGQVDQFGLALFMLTLYYLLVDRPKRAAIVFTISWLMKFQNIIFIPIFYLYLFKKYGGESLVKSLLWSVITFLVIIFPFWFNRETAGLIKLFTVNSDWFPWYSLNAFNFWWLAAGGKGLTLSDKTLVWGVVNAKTIGFFGFSFFYLIACLRVFLAERNKLFRELILSTILIMFAFFHVLTQSHERYLFHLMGLWLVLMMIVNQEKSKYSADSAAISFPASARDQRQAGKIAARLQEPLKSHHLPDNFFSLTIFYLLLSLTLFFNLYISAALNYPDQVVWPVGREATINLTFWLSYLQIGLFVWFFVWFFSGWVKQYWYLVTAAVIVFSLVLAGENINYWLGRPISLTDIKPVHESQEYLPPQINKTVESFRGAMYWNRLSNNYYFYEKGIGGHADSEIVYSLGGRFSKLRTDIGIDTEGSAEAKAYFVVEGDGKLLYRSEAQGRFDNPRTIEVPIKGVNKLTLRIIKAGDTNYGAHADWLEPTLFK